ncbi:MAG: hypothetical protein K2H22_02970 [Muribaculaceae bacterium]|nr:hypothetical protein [Muribaculaceae bacterium]
MLYKTRIKIDSPFDAVFADDVEAVDGGGSIGGFGRSIFLSIGFAV